MAAVIGVVAVLGAGCGYHPNYHTGPAAPVHTGATTVTQMFGADCGPRTTATTAGPGRSASWTSLSHQPAAVAVAAIPQLSTFSHALHEARLVYRLDTQPGGTIFAPTNTAFAEFTKTVGTASIEDALDDNTESLASTMKYFVLGQRYNRQGLLAAGAVHPLAGGNLHVSKHGAVTTVTTGAGVTATVLCGNIPTANATLFIINKVLTARTAWFPDPKPNCIGVTDPALTRCGQQDPAPGGVDRSAPDHPAGFNTGTPSWNATPAAAPSRLRRSAHRRWPAWSQPCPPPNPSKRKTTGMNVQLACDDPRSAEAEPISDPMEVLTPPRFVLPDRIGVSPSVKPGRLANRQGVR